MGGMVNNDSSVPQAYIIARRRPAIQPSFAALTTTTCVVWVLQVHAVVVNDLPIPTRVYRLQVGRVMSYHTGRQNSMALLLLGHILCLWRPVMSFLIPTSLNGRSVLIRAPSSPLLAHAVAAPSSAGGGLDRAVRRCCRPI